LLATAVALLVLTPGAARGNTIVVTFTVPLPIQAVVSPGLLDLGSTNFQQFNPALGTFNDVQVTLTGSFNWVTSPPSTLDVENKLDSFTLVQQIPGVPVMGNVVPVTVDVMGTTNFATTLQFVTGTSTVNDEVIIAAITNVNFENTIGGGMGTQIVNLQGTVTYDFDPSAAVPEPATWALMLLGFVGLGLAFKQSRRKVSMA
jgi:hypothetical protein